MAPHSSTLAWRVPWTEEPGRRQSLGSHRVGHDWATSLSLFTFHFHVLEKEMATHSSVLAWRVPGMGEPGGLLSVGSQSRTRLKWLSKSIRHIFCFNIWSLTSVPDTVSKPLGISWVIAVSFGLMESWCTPRWELPSWLMRTEWANTCNFNFKIT